MKIFVTGGSGFIGTNLVDRLIADGHEVTNFDIAAPEKNSHAAFWIEGSIMDSEKLADALSKCDCDHVVHLAARCDCDENTTVEEGYTANTVGVENLCEAIRQSGELKRAVIVSSQYVCGPGVQPESSDHYAPHTVYGQSKVETEKIVKNAGLDVVWTLVRPTNIWGPWHRRYQKEFWSVVKRGLYVHPGGEPVVRCYGYVGNVVDQISTILSLPEDKVGGKAFYAGDEQSDIYEWTNAFSLGLRGTRAKRVPRPILRMIGIFGDLCGGIGMKFPLTSSRFRSMTEDYSVDMSETFRILGTPPYSIKQGVDETVAWLKTDEQT